MAPGVLFAWSSALTAFVYLIAVAPGNPLRSECKGKHTLYTRGLPFAGTLSSRDDPAVWPWPANNSTIVDGASKPNMPPQNLTFSNSPASNRGRIPRKFIEKKCDAR